MDELAGTLKVSKKTFYKYFSSKDQIVRDCAFFFMQKNIAALQNIVSSDENPILKLLNLLTHLGNNIATINKVWLEDVRTTMPSLWLEIDEFRKERLECSIEILYRQGLEQGLFKKYPEHFIIRLFSVSIRGIMHPDFILSTSYEPKSALMHTINLLLSGILTETGLAVYKDIQIRN
ncbi:MAG: hypothetical protein AMXMBFR48_03140 [Ignavibacteriales bacterium]